MSLLEIINKPEMMIILIIVAVFTEYYMYKKNAPRK